MDVPYSELDPGIRNTVRWLNDNDFSTHDSGDGVSKFVGDDPMDCALPFPHVVMLVSAAELIPECDRLCRLLRAAGVRVEAAGPEGTENVEISGNYDPACGLVDAVVWLANLDDKGLAAASK